MSLTPEDKARRLSAKRSNEHIKLLVVTLNAMALTTFAAALVLPSFNPTLPKPSSPWILLAIGRHLLAQSLLRLMRSED